LLAPGARIVSTALGGGRVSKSGTSASTPHAAAVAALIVQGKPDVTPLEIETALKDSGVSVTDQRNGRTTPRVDALAAVTLVLSDHITTSLAVVPDDLQLYAGAATTTVVQVESVSNLYSVDLRLTFDPGVLRVVDVVPDTPGEQIAVGALFDGRDYLVSHNQVDNTAGVVEFAISLQNQAEPISGTGGVAGSGGTSSGGGTGGDDASSSPACPPSLTGGTSLLPDLIDDFEDQDDALPAGLGTPPRAGYWYAFHDDTAGGVMVPGGSQLPPTALDPARGDSEFGVFASAAGFTTWGAGIGVDLNNSGEKEPYDASAYDGIVFWAKGSTTGTPVELRVPIPATAPPGEGGSCTAASGCSGYHRYTLGELDDEWQQISIHFCQLIQPSWALEAEFDSSQILSIQFQGTETSDFEIWVDDLSFFTVQ